MLAAQDLLKGRLNATIETLDDQIDVSGRCDVWRRQQHVVAAFSIDCA